MAPSRMVTVQMVASYYKCRMASRWSCTSRWRSIVQSCQRPVLREPPWRQVGWFRCGTAACWRGTAPCAHSPRGWTPTERDEVAVQRMPTVGQACKTAIRVWMGDWGLADSKNTQSKGRSWKGETTNKKASCQSKIDQPPLPGKKVARNFPQDMKFSFIGRLIPLDFFPYCLVPLTSIDRKQFCIFT